MSVQVAASGIKLCSSELKNERKKKPFVPCICGSIHHAETPYYRTCTYNYLHTAKGHLLPRMFYI